MLRGYICFFYIVLPSLLVENNVKEQGIEGKHNCSEGGRLNISRICFMWGFRHPNSTTKFAISRNVSYRSSICYTEVSSQPIYFILAGFYLLLNCLQILYKKSNINHQIIFFLFMRSQKFRNFTILLIKIFFLLL